MAQADISRIETGTKAISMDVLDRLCRALKCEPGDILVRKGK
ncbi:MAG: helix-turn-helix domain-containing protein [Gemmatimonadetes bacterium]|nr:helix-turn-helix domain-containing protein [Gemmatimonadota bacterium]